MGFVLRNETKYTSCMPHRWFLLPAVGLSLLLPASARAQSVEFSFFLGQTVPTYDQAFNYAPDIGLPVISGVTIQQQGSFQLSAKGGPAFGGSVSFFPVDFFGVELRVDSVDFQIETSAPSFDATVNLPPPLPPLSGTLDLDQGQFDVDRLNPVSVNLKLRTPGNAKFFVSGGFSYLPELTVTARQEVGLGVTGIEALTDLSLGAVSLRAEPLPADLIEQDGGRWGANAGAGVQVFFTDNVGLTGEVRVFRFSTQRFVWRGDGPTGSSLEQELVQELEEALPVIAIEPIFFHAVGGIVLRF